MKNKITLRGIRDGAMMTALTVIFMLLSLYVPLFSFIGMFLSGIPLAALYARDGLATSVCAAVCSVLIMFAFTGNILSVLSLAAAYTIPGLVAGICLKKKYNFFYSVIFTGTAFLAGLLLELLMIKLFMGGIDNMLSEFFTGARTALEEALNAVGDKNSGIDIKQTAENLMDTVIYTAKLYFPSILIVSSLFSAYLMYSFAGFILKKLRLCSVKTVPFYMLRAPKSMSIAAVIFYFINLFLTPDSVVGAAVYNIIFVIYAFIALCGFSFIDYKFRSIIKKGSLRALIYVAVFFLGGIFLTLIINICIIIGILDGSMNFRKISAIDEENEN